MELRAHELKVERTARVLTHGDPRTARETWFLLHGYAQLAGEMLEACAPLARPARLLVVPEALSRFYRRGSSGPIGASWMTREARELEIADYVAYLERVALWCERELGARATTRVAFGFSQGTATAWRWALLGATPLARFVSWGGHLPNDLDLARHRARLAALRVDLVRGTRDGYATAEVLVSDVRRLAELGVSPRTDEFDGGHELAANALSQLE